MMQSQRIEWTPRLDAALIVLRRRGLTLDAIGARMGFSRDTIRTRLDRLAFDDPRLRPLLDRAPRQANG